MHRPRAPSPIPLSTTTHHHQEQTVHYTSSSSSVVPLPARPEGNDITQAGHPRDNDVPAWQVARDIVRGVIEDLHGPHPQTHRGAAT